MIAFLHEKYMPKGGPSGGNGGRGASIIFRANKSLNTLYAFRHSRVIIGEDGENGMPKNKYGRGAQDVIVEVPVGTIIYEEKDNNRGRVCLLYDGNAFKCHAHDDGDGSG